MTEKKKLTREQAMALVAAEQAKIDAKAKLALAAKPVEASVIPQPNDPLFVPAFILKLIEFGGDVDSTLAFMRCTFADYLAVSATAEFKTAYNNIVAAKVDIPNRLAARLAVTETAKEGNAYALKTLHDTRLGETSSEEEQRALSELRVADRATLGRQLEAGAKRLIGMLEVVRGLRYALVEQRPDETTVAVIEPTEVDIATDIAQPYELDDQAPDGE